MDLEQFKTAYSLRVRRANYWSDIKGAYQDYQDMGKEKFEKELQYRVELENFGRRFYEELREKFNADYECVEFYFQMMKAQNWSYDDFDDYLQRLEDEDEEDEDEEENEEDEDEETN